MKSTLNIFLIIVMLALVIVPRLPVPGPTPIPVPPPPVTSPLRVLMAYDTTDVTSWPAATREVLVDTDVRTYLNGHCPLEDGTPAFRIWDQNSDISTAPKFKAQWDLAKASGKKSNLVVTTTTKTDVLDIPDDKTKTLTLLETYGGK